MKNKWISKRHICFKASAWILLFVFIIAGVGAYYFSFPPKKSVAVLYIATGRYMLFWDKFYNSVEKNFLPDFKKHFYVWTDNADMKFPQNVTRILRKQKGFPKDSIERFSMFLEKEKELASHNYIYFFNSNAEVVAPVGHEILPTDKQGIAVTVHPGYWHADNRDNMQYPYDRNPKSEAYIPFGQGIWYVQGGFNGGISADYLKLIKALDSAVNRDFKKGVMAVWHDESHLNKYILDKNPLVLPPSYIWAAFDPKIIPEFEGQVKIEMRNKAYYGGTYWLRRPAKAIATDFPENGYVLEHPYWEDFIVPTADKNVYCRVSQKTECGVVSWAGLKLTMRWNHYAAENFGCSSIGNSCVFVPAEAFFVKQKGWDDWMIPDDNNTVLYCRLSNPKECGPVSFSKNKDAVTITWEHYVPETFVLDKHKHMYFIKEN